MSNSAWGVHSVDLVSETWLGDFESEWLSTHPTQVTFPKFDTSEVIRWICLPLFTSYIRVEPSLYPKANIFPETGINRVSGLRRLIEVVP